MTGQIPSSTHRSTAARHVVVPRPGHRGMSGYGKWITDSKAVPGQWTWLATPKTPTDTREVALELLAWTDAHETVTITIPRKTAEWFADGGKVWWSKPADELYPTAENCRLVGEACRKAMGTTA